jgi:Na+-translocating ferredoxin:NAD+ oxidoreductase RNF subunit RnfB
MNLILIALIVLGVIGAIGALVLHVVAKKFYVYEDPRVGQVEEVLPGANCGGCGFPGCHGMADACVKASSLDGLMCPVGGADVMAKVAGILGMEAGAAEPKLAVVRCNGDNCVRPKRAVYDGAKSCAVANATFAGETGCVFGCIGLGDCVEACQFDAIHINEERGLPEVDADKCVACGACVKACPKLVIELRKKGRIVQGNARRVWVECVNKDKGGVAMKNCKNACIGCGKCQKVCKFDAITIENNLSYIDPDKCKACGMCVNECPTHAIHCTFTPPAPKPKPAPAAAAENAAAAAKVAETKVAEAKEAVKDAVVAKVAEVKETAAAKAAEVKEAVAAKVEEVKPKVEAKAAEVKEAVAEKAAEVKEAAAAKAAEVKEAVAAKVEEVKPKVEAKAAEVKEAVAEKAAEAKEAVAAKAAEVKEAVAAKVADIKEDLKKD